MRFLLVTADPYPELLGELRRLGHSVTVEGDPVEAGRVLAREPVEVLAVEAARLVSGSRWLESLRASSTAGVMVLGLAASLAEEELEPLLAAGVDEYLVAPFAPAEVRGRLRLLARKRAASEELLRARGQGEVARLADIIQLQSGVMQAGLDQQRLMQQLCEGARVLCGAEGAAVGTLEGAELVFRYAVGTMEPFTELRLPVEKSFNGASVLRGEVLHAEDCETDERVNHDQARELGIRSMIAVPLRHGERTVGVLDILSSRPHAFDTREVRTLELIAGLIGTAMANATEYQAKQALAAELSAALSALRESQELFDSFMNNSPALAYMKDGEGRRVWVNAPYRRFYHLESAELGSLEDQDLMAPAIAEQVRRRDLEVLQSGQPSLSEALIPAPDGTEHHWLTYRFIVRDSAGRRFVAGVSLEITERKRAEAALRRSEQSFRALIEGSPEAIFVHRGGPLVYVNPAALRFLELHRAAVVGTSMLQYVHPEDQEAVAGLLDAEPSRVRSERCELRFVKSTGRVMTAEVSCLSVVFDGEAATMVSARDLTERNQMQSRLVLSDRLVAMGTLAAGVAHEINNPLSYVLSNLSFLATELRALAPELPPGRLEELEEVLREATVGGERVRQIVGDLKTFSRADDDLPTAVSMQNVLESALAIARSELRPRAMVVRDYAEVPPVEGSAGRFGQVFLNLLINAAQAIPPGQPEQHQVRVQLRAVQEHVIIEIQDTGAGIPPELRSRIFDPFFTTKPVGVGTGLGLFVCQGIVARFGGEISVESEVGKGTTFRVIFPSAREGRERRLSPAPRLPGEGRGRRA
ncbi:MAG: PAS domain S-box protein [Myxococcaceae bacterium]|nr:PAS domain S-box protein [Myxococcaceae bacterium]